MQLMMGCKILYKIPVLALCMLAKSSTRWQTYCIMCVIANLLKLPVFVLCVLAKSSKCLSGGRLRGRDLLAIQENLFRVAGLPMVENCMAGYNSSMFAYGQASTSHHFDYSWSKNKPTILSGCSSSANNENIGRTSWSE
jgi:hypothetical protein